MLIPDNIHPEQTIFYNGALVLEQLRKQSAENLVDLYVKTNAVREMSMAVFILCLDWLFLINLVELTDKGEVQLCS